jgi:lipopolysaccharide transport system ATP-binding protein
MSNDLALRVRGVSKAYRIAHAHARATTIAEALMRRLRHPFASTTTEEFWAVRDIDFEVKKGEVVGIIGRNGAGKSTLLKLLSRITTPSTGRIELYGRVGSLLEVGTGFHPELTGRENIYLNGQILGMRKREINKHFDAIVDFAGVGRFLDTPVKRYSSGMYVRLAFAVAAYLESEILIIDEVLAVGDAEFQAKCLGKMHDVARDGRTVLFVSHNMPAVQTLCTSAWLLAGGRIIDSGPVESVARRYLQEGQRVTNGYISLAEHDQRKRGHDVWLRGLTLSTEDGQPSALFATGQPLRICIDVVPPREIDNPRLAIAIEDQGGRRLCASANYFYSRRAGSHRRPFRATIDVNGLPLAPGRYFISASIAESHGELLDSVDHAGWFEIEWSRGYESGEAYNSAYGPLLLDADWRVEERNGNPAVAH